MWDSGAENSVIKCEHKKYFKASMCHNKLYYSTDVDTYSTPHYVKAVNLTARLVPYISKSPWIWDTLQYYLTFIPSKHSCQKYYLSVKTCKLCQQLIIIISAMERFHPR